MSRAFTPEELRDQFLETARGIAKYWAEVHGKSAQDRCDAVVFSLLSIIDGTDPNIPAFDLVARPHPDDRAYNKSHGKNWVEDGTVINDGELHDVYYT